MLSDSRPVHPLGRCHRQAVEVFYASIEKSLVFLFNFINIVRYKSMKRFISILFLLLSLSGYAQQSDEATSILSYLQKAMNFNNSTCEEMYISVEGMTEDGKVLVNE